ncbi:MAG: hypothetical protein U5K99_06565 [Anaerolineales bacterium]|nr:hypothetical protein [Anaerolineales bacterium]
MDKKKYTQTLQVKKVSRSILMILAAFWFGFSLFSGAESFGGGWRGLLANSPNALPWLALLIFVYFSWTYEIISGALITAEGIFTLFFFDAFNSLFVLLTISLPILLLGFSLLVTGYLTRKPDDPPA